ncbi:hypothetical protein TanjilG_07881 [Lupinus angustifolius]|uniref:RRM domain-containing protein n=1 Tax=Lupinus angustifolius TaxID=3871 RepID=A0A1J7GQA4_LUPAN|nr:PREDICTED: uncharacterized protein LOC109327980 [Lupinus angustifolius]OIV96489.1 hypothetical protein TanjilG_07881 [Lupinus angustifolius]
MSPISVEELYIFHRIDREVFFRLVIRLARNPAQSLLVMAFWLWIESIKYPKFITKLVGLSDPLINTFANEAVTGLRCLEMEYDDTPESGGGLPLTTILMQEEISLQFFRQKRFTIIVGIRCVLNKICARIFTDILQYLLGSANTSTSISYPSHYRPLVVPGFPHPLFGTFTIPPINFEELDLFDPRIWITMHGYDDGATDDDKTMFLTFSRGFPVTKEEVWHLFTRIYGDCIKFLNMGNGNINDQVLFATMVLNNVEIVDRILNGMHVAKFRLNGKHIWARKYERRDYI